MGSGLATKNLLHSLNHHRDDALPAECAANDQLPDSLNGPNAFGLPLKEIVSPHDVEARKWFRRALITLCVCGFLLIFIPDGIRKRLNAWAGTPTAAQPLANEISMLCKNDWHERCLVCTHLDASGQRVQSTHC